MKEFFKDVIGDCVSTILVGFVVFIMFALLALAVEILAAIVS